MAAGQALPTLTQLSLISVTLTILKASGLQFYTQMENGHLELIMVSIYLDVMDALHQAWVIWLLCMQPKLPNHMFSSLSIILMIDPIPFICKKSFKGMMYLNVKIKQVKLDIFFNEVNINAEFFIIDYLII